MSCIFPFKAYKCSIGKYGLSQSAHTFQDIFVSRARCTGLHEEGPRAYVKIWLTFSASAGAIWDPLCGFFSCSLARKTRWETWNGNWKIEKRGVELKHGSLCFIGPSDITFVPPRQSLFMLRYYLKRCTLSSNLPNEILSFFFLSSLIDFIPMAF